MDYEYNIKQGLDLQGIPIFLLLIISQCSSKNTNI